MDKRDFERLLGEYQALRKKEQDKMEDIRKDFNREYDRMEERIENALKSLIVQEGK